MAKKKGRKVSSTIGGGSDGIPTAGVEEEVSMDVNGDAIEDVVKDDDDDAAAAVAVASSDINANGWVLARVLDPSSDSAPGTACRTDGCETTAVNVWTKTAAPPNDADEWPLCEECEAALAGGSDEQAKSATSVDAIVSSPEQPEAPTENEEEKNDVNELDLEEAKEGVEEVWELRRILSIKDITESATKCSNPKCKTPAACVYVSNLSPGDEWFSCLDCQVRSDSRTCSCSHPSLRSPLLTSHSIFDHVTGRRVRWLPSRRRAPGVEHERRAPPDDDHALLPKEEPHDADLLRKHAADRNAGQTLQAGPGHDHAPPAA
jgi:hypothetical protein